MTDTMRYIQIAAAGGPEQLVLRECALPKPKTGQVLIKVTAAGVKIGRAHV